MLNEIITVYAIIDDLLKGQNLPAVAELIKEVLNGTRSGMSAERVPKPSGCASTDPCCVCKFAICNWLLQF